MFNNLKKTQQFGQCRCCLDFGHQEDFFRNEIQQVYRQTFLATFNLCLSSNPCLPQMICKSCIGRLTDAAEFIAMVKASEQYMLNNTETTSDIEFVNIAPSSAQEEEIIHPNELIKEEEDEIEHGQDVSPSGSIDGDTIIGVEAHARLQVKLTRLPDKLLQQHIKHDMNKSTHEKNEVAVYNDKSSAVKTELLEQISQEYEQIDNALIGTECEGNIGEGIDYQSRDLKLMSAVGVRTHVCVEHADTHTDSASSLKSADDYAPRTQTTATTCGINQVNNTHIASISPDTDKNTDNTSSQTIVNECPANIKQTKPQNSELSMRNAHKCFVCKYTTNEESALEYHLKMHSDTTQYICDACSYITNEKKILIRHLTLHPDEFSDSKCYRNSDFKRHGGTHTGVKPYQCEICSHEFSDKSNLNRHIRTHTGVKPYECDICNKAFTAKFTLKSHMTIHTGVKPYECDICNKTFAVRYNLKSHMTTHIGIKPFKCEICSHEFYYKSHLNRHIRTHTGIKPYKCEICSLEFSNKSDLNRHIRTHTGFKPYKCDICNKAFTVKYTLTSHMTTHTGIIKPYKCEICSLEFSNKSNLNRHIIRTHTGVKPYECDICNMAFTVKYTLTSHMTTHTGIKPYKCEICSREFLYKSQLNTHIRTHTGVKPYQCEICSHEFSYKYNLNTHIRTHTGIKPYECDICNKTFAEKGTLKSHMTTHTGIKPYKCEICSKGFSQKSNMKTHIRTHTGIKP